MGEDMVIDSIPIIVEDLIIGRTWGECFPTSDCARLFQLSGGLVYRDVNVDRFSRRDTASDLSYFEFEADPVFGTDSLIVDSLLTMIPQFIDYYDTADFGCPGCGDEAVLVILVNRGSENQYIFELDSQTEFMIPALRPYGELMNRALDGWRR